MRKKKEKRRSIVNYKIKIQTHWETVKKYTDKNSEVNRRSVKIYKNANPDITKASVSRYAKNNPKAFRYAV